MKFATIVAILATVGCGATAKAVEHAEYECLQADLDSAEQKLETLLTDPTAEAVALTEQEVKCALGALGAKPPTAGAGSALQGPPSAGAKTSL